MDENKTTVIGRDAGNEEARDKVSLESVALNAGGNRKPSLESVPLNAPVAPAPDSEFVSYAIGTEIELPCDDGDITVKITDIISAAGQTGEASVYKVQDSRNRSLALKIYRQLRTEDEPNPVALQRIKQISDEDILPLLAYGVGKYKLSGKYCWELQVFAEGGNLLSVPDLKAKYSAEFIEKEIVPQLLKGLWKMHDVLIYHCDLKPQNIFYLDKAQRDIVIGDYGSAKTKEVNISDSFVFSKRIVGTHTYIPPEFHEGFIKDNSDYFSMGMIILELLYNEAFANDPLKVKEEISLRRNRHEPIFNYDKRYERLNKLIEGCTLASWDRRWNREDIVSWQKGKIPPIIYRDTKQVQELKLTRKVGVKSVDELVEYAWGLDPDEFHSVLIQDDGVFMHIQSWIFDMLSADDAKNFSQIRKVYGLKGKHQLKEALLRYLEPMLPLVLEGKLFNWKEGEVLQTVQSYLDHLLNSGIPSNPRIMNNAVFALEYALLSLCASDVDTYRNDAKYLLEMMRLVLMDLEKKDPILGNLVSCDEQKNASFFNKRLKLLLACLKETGKRTVKGASEEMPGLVRKVIRQEKLQQELFKEAEQKEFKAFEVDWWKRFIHPRMHSILNVYIANKQNTGEVAFSIMEAFYDLDGQDMPWDFIAREVKELDGSSHTLASGALQKKLDRIATLIKALHKTCDAKDKEKLKKLVECLPYYYHKENEYPPWEAKMPNPEKTLIKMAWICNPQRGIRSSDNRVHQTFTGFLLNHLQNNGDVEKDLREANEFCNMKRGSDHDYASFFFLLKEEHKWIDQAMIKVETGKDVDIQDLVLSWQDWSVKCNALIYPSVVLRYEQEGKQVLRQYCPVAVDEKRKIEMPEAFSLGRKNLGSKVNLGADDGAQKLEALIVKEASGTAVPGLAESTFHETRVHTTSSCIARVDESYKKHLASEAEIGKEKSQVWLRESFRWLSMAIIAPLTWIAHGLWYDIKPELVPVFLFVIPLIILIGALPYFHKNQAKWWILALMGIILGIAFVKGGSSFDRMQILLAWQKWVIIGIALTHLISFLSDNEYRSSRVTKVANWIFWLMGAGVFAVVALNGSEVKTLIRAEHDRTMGAISCIRIPGGDATFQGRPLKLDPYYIAEREVTVSDFREFTSNSSYYTEAEQGGGSLVFPKRSAWAEFWSGRKEDFRSNASWRNPYMNQTESHPVVCVSFVDAVNFCNWLSTKEGYKPCYSFHKGKISCNWKANGYRLPTEAEWEWAAAGASDYGSSPSKASEYKKIAWYKGNTKFNTKPVMKKRPNAMGLYDMIGNVFEWCWDRHSNDIPDKLTDNYHGPISGNYRCIRGGSWYTSTNKLDYKVRTRNGWIKNNDSIVLSSSSFIGFRVVRGDKG